MIRRILLENFMSHARTEIEPAEGLTVLVGPNNCGKSAVILAMQTLCDPGARGRPFMLRHGEREVSVAVETEEGVVRWSRSAKGGAALEVNGEALDRLSLDRDNATRRVHAVLRMPRVASEDAKTEFDVHFAEQKDPIFLLDEPGSAAATFFAQSSDARYLLHMQRLFRDRMKEARGIELAESREIEVVEAELARLAPLDEIETALREADALHAEGVRADAAEAALEAAILGLSKEARGLASATRRERALHPLERPPALEDEREPAELIAHLEVTGEARAEALARATALDGLRQPPALEDEIEPAARVVELEAARRALREARMRAEALDALGPLAPIEEAEERERRLVEDLAAMHAAGRSRARPLARKGALDALEAPPDLADETALATLTAELERATNAARRAGARREELADLLEPPPVPESGALEEVLEGLNVAARARREAELAVGRSEAALREWIAAHPSCPFCGGPLGGIARPA